MPLVLRTALVVALLSPGASCGGNGNPRNPTGCGDEPHNCTNQLLAAGAEHTCAVRPDGTVACWGLNDHGQLGDGSTSDHSTPLAVSGLSNVVALAAGADHTCAVKIGGSVVCWGSNDHGQLGDGSTADRSTPVTVSAMSNVVALAAGVSHTCALKDDGTVACWGFNAVGQLGDGSTTDRWAPVTVQDLANVVALAAGSFHTCAVKNNGTATCWGSNNNGQLGDGSTTDWPTPVTRPVAVSNVSNAIGLGAGSEHTCAIKDDGTVACWGSNFFGEVGDGSTPDRSTPVIRPVAVANLSNVVALTVRRGHNCALKDTGTVVCWGFNAVGQLGDGSTTNRSIPVTVQDLSNVVALAAGSAHTCALSGSGTISCWGSRRVGQLGDGFYTSRSTTPVAVSDLSNVVELAAGGFRTCALKNDATVACWGDDDSNAYEPSRPFTVSNLSNVVALAAGGRHTCALKNNGTAACWGSNADGQLGDGTTTDRSIPVSVSNLSSVLALTAGAAHTCALKDDGTVVCWGSNSVGALGDGSMNNQRLTPVGVLEVSNVVALAAGDFHTCALKEGGTVACWGLNAMHSLTAAEVSGLSRVVALTAGASHTCALKEGGTVACWGYNSYGELGIGSGDQPSEVEPVGVEDLSNVVALGAGSHHTCAVRSDGTVACWGDNNDGQLGDGSSGHDEASTDRNKRLTPVTVLDLSDVGGIVAGSTHTCALKVDGTVACWGSNSSGQLGDGIAPIQTVPVSVIGLP